MVTKNTLTVTDVSAGYGTRLAVRNVSFVAETGITIILGKNGSGKSTLLNVLAGLHLPLQGNVIVNTKNILSASVTERSRIVAYVPQNPVMEWHLPVRETIALGRYPFRHTAQAKNDEYIIDRILAECSLEDFAERSTGNLSGGELQRVILARALCQEPAVLLLDEPVSAMDPANIRNTATILSSVAARGTIVIAVLHDALLAQSIADRVVIITDGKITAIGTQKEVITPKILSNAFDIPFFQSVTEGNQRVIIPDYR